MADKQFNYQATTTELETIIAKLESGNMEIDQALSAYQDAQKLIAELEHYLKTAENKIKKIKQT